jgi:predicted CopG family antitoxin
MARLIHVSDDVYGLLTKMKGKKSYSVVIRELAEHKSNKEKVLSFFGKGGIDAAKVKELSAGWKKWTDEYA